MNLQPKPAQDGHQISELIIHAEGKRLDSHALAHHDEGHKISDLVAAAMAQGKPFVSLEFFPPRTVAGVVNLRERLQRLKVTFVLILSVLIALCRGAVCLSIGYDTPADRRAQCYDHGKGYLWKSSAKKILWAEFGLAFRRCSA